MTLKVPRSWIPSASQWDEAWRQCPYSTYFQCREWAETWKSFTDGHHEPAPLALNLADGLQVLFPFSKNASGLNTSYIASPAGTFGGWLANRPLVEAEQKIILPFIARHYPNLSWRFNPYEKVLPEIKSGTIRQEVTHTLELTAGFDSVVGQWTKNHASTERKARKARMAGVVIRLAETQQDWQEYYAMYQSSLQRWGDKASSKYDWRLFELLHERNSPDIKLWLAEYQGKRIAGALCFYSPSHAVYWHGAAQADSFAVRPVNLLMHEAIKDAAESGRRWFDFNPSGGHEGVAAFKKSFGAKSMESNVVISTTRLASFTTIIRQFKRRLVK